MDPDRRSLKEEITLFPLEHDEMPRWDFEIICSSEMRKHPKTCFFIVLDVFDVYKDFKILFLDIPDILPGFRYILTFARFS